MIGPMLLKKTVARTFHETNDAKANLTTSASTILPPPPIRLSKRNSVLNCAGGGRRMYNHNCNNGTRNNSAKAPNKMVGLFIAA
jgi:hypothetical protein